jgi:predicted metal-dependent peptidase
MPYFGQGLHRMPVQVIPGFAKQIGGPMGITKEGVLCVDPDALEALNADECGGGLIHEYLHLYFRHHQRFEAMCQQGTANKSHWKIANIAQDLEINDDLEHAGIPLPKGCVYPKTFGFPPGKSFEEYFRLLMDMAEEQGGLGGKGEGCDCGSGASGHARDGEPVGHAEGRSAVDKEIQGKVDAAAVAKAAESGQGQGKIPDRVKLQAKADLEPKRVDWRQELARAARRMTSVLSGVDDYSYERPARMQPDFGGSRARFPGMVRLDAEVAFVADTSGSMGADQGKLIGQVKRILAALPGSKLRFVACDADVHADLAVRTAKQAEANLVGGGGTSFIPAFQRLMKGKRPDLIVFGTDGFGDYPATPPPCKVIWLVTPGGRISVPWGKQIQLGA